MPQKNGESYQCCLKYVRLCFCGIFIEVKMVIKTFGFLAFITRFVYTKEKSKVGTSKQLGLEKIDFN